MADSTVMIVCQNARDNTRISFDLPRSASLQELRTRWSKESKLPWTEHRFRLGSSSLPEGGSIADVATEFVLPVTVVPRVTAHVSLLGAADWRCSVDVTETMKVEDVVRTARDALGLGNTRRGRLFQDGSDLPADQSAMELAGPLLLDLEVTCSISIIAAAEPKPHLELDVLRTDFEREAKERRLVRAFCSQAVASLCPEFASGRLRLERDPRPLEPTRCLADLVQEPEICLGRPLLFSLELPFPLLLQRASGQREWLLAWPSDTPASLTAGPRCQLNDGRPLPADHSFLSSGLMQYSCLRETCKSLRLLVSDSFSGKMYVVRIDPEASGTDLHEEVETIVGGDGVGDFRLRFEGRKVDHEWRPLVQLGIGEDASLELRRRARPVLLTLEEQSCRLEAVPLAIPFADFLQRAEQALGISLPPDTRFQCPCGRVVSYENARSSRLPKNCCSGDADNTLELQVKIPQELDFSGQDGAKVQCR